MKRGASEVTVKYTEGVKVYSLRDAKGAWAPHVALFATVNGWRVEMQLALQRGRLIVSEVHVTPSEPGKELARVGIEHRSRGIHAEAPAAGVTARLLASLPLHAHTKALIKELRNPHSRGMLEVILMGTGAESLLGAVPARPPSGPRRGRKPIPVDRLLAVAAAYSKATAKGSERPVADAAVTLHETVERVRDLVHRARSRGLLTPTMWGRGGGALTDKAKALLKGTKKGGKR